MGGGGEEEASGGAEGGAIDLQGHAAVRYPALSFRPKHYSQFLPVVTDIAFHEPSRKLLLACKRQSGGIGIGQLTPKTQTPTESCPSWILEDETSLRFSSLKFNPIPAPASVIHALQPAPRNSRLTCIAGTDKGILQLQQDTLTWTTPPPPSRARFRSLHHHRQNNNSNNNNNKDRTQAHDRLPWQTDILAVDFLSPDTILAGTRSGHVCVLDLRAPPREWSVGAHTFRHTSSAAHVRAVRAPGAGAGAGTEAGTPHEVLAAGPRNAMAVYDLRFLQQPQQQPGEEGRRGGKNKNATRPVVEFHAYRNEAHIQIGLDVWPEAGYGSSRGVVAAAHDDQTVGLYSLRDGLRLEGAGAVGGIRAPAVVRRLMWAALPGDRHPSLFVGEGNGVGKYSFWA
ncbi:hypothetical protein NEMBOFW57_004361 [Staphylotrichum longicolle]|uniref:Uncharacterized protein n=1 Tax=Staphylotrichum longicolle TaxID=669026 RepID=A0AAD4F7X6_9PEZI|nr:hypothetical protein NEMBOFW57_004361 [Staphylotrichum longicolle]